MSHHHHHHHEHGEGPSRTNLIRIIVTVMLLIVLHCLPESMLPTDGWVRLAVYVAVYLFIGFDILKEAAEGIIHGEVFDENFLMVVATLGAFGLALFEGNGDYDEAIAVMLFFQIGEYFQGYAVSRSRKNITSLMDIRPDYACIERDGTVERINPEKVDVGTVIVVRPGERIPIDGTVVEGSSSLDQSALTGESLPHEIGEGDEVMSGCINMTGELRVRTTCLFGESTVSKILRLVSDSDSNRSESERFITRFARYYTPIICYLALAIALLPPLVHGVLGIGGGWGQGMALFTTWIYRALTFLVISCPCALVISIPMSFFAGIGGASCEGVLIKGSNYLERLAKVRRIVFDKTGTLTLGVFEVNAIHNGHDSDHDTEEERQRLLELTALAECSSTHPISKSIQRAYAREIDHRRVSHIEEHGGMGVTAIVDGHHVVAGNEKLLKLAGIEACHCHTAGTIVHVAIDGHYAGHIVLGDIVKQNTEETMRQLARQGLTDTVMLTGDSQEVAAAVASRIGIGKVYSSLLPTDKVNHVKRMQADGQVLAFVGDGINDAPVLTTADIGIAMGGVGSDAAIEAADIVLMDDDPLKLCRAIAYSRKCMGIVWQNIVFAIGIKVVCLVLGAFGIANMWLAVFADVGVMILAVINALRAFRVRR